MGKRSSFERKERDFYPTPKEAVLPLLPWLGRGIDFSEPCCGELDLVNHLEEAGHNCVFYSDIERGLDALEIPEFDGDFLITNPPWDRSILHPMIEHFRNRIYTWLLFDADWMHTKQASPYLKHCSQIISVGRVKWIPDSKYTGKDNCAWYLFGPDEYETHFIGR